MKYKLLVFRFVFLDDRYLFPIIINNDDFKKAKKEYDLVHEIMEKLNELPGLEQNRKLLEKVDSFENLQKELNSMVGEITANNIKSIDVMLRKAVPLKPEDFNNLVFEKFIVNNIHLPIRKFDNFNDFDINPFVIIDIKD